MYQALLIMLVVLACSACAPDARRLQLERLLARLTDARTELVAQPLNLDPACGEVGAVSSRLNGEPGLVEAKPAWPALRAATDALLAVCGNATLLGQPFEPTPATLQARQRWQDGIGRELARACRELERAGAALSQRVAC